MTVHVNSNIHISSPEDIQVRASDGLFWIEFGPGVTSSALHLSSHCTVANAMAARDALRACFAPAAAVREVA